MGETILFRRGTFANLPDLQEGEPGWCTDTKELFIGTSAGTAEAAQKIGPYEIDALAYAPNTFTKATIDACLLAIGTSDERIITFRPGTWVIDADADWSAYQNIVWNILPGAVFQIATATTTTIGGPLGDQSPMQKFNCVGTGIVKFGIGSTQRFMGEWFGAPANGTDDDSTAFQKLADCMSAVAGPAATKNITTIYMPGAYHFHTPITFSTDYIDVRVEGDSMAGFGKSDSALSCITGNGNALDAVFEFDIDHYSFECTHIKAYGNSEGTKVVSFMKGTGGEAPAGPIVIKNCEFRGFDKVLYSSITGVKSSGMYEISVTENCLSGNNYAVYAEGHSNSILNFNFIGNKSNAGGCIRVVSGAGGGNIAGGFNISNNDFEGQADAIYIEGGGFQGYIGSNYFESNTGYIFYVTATNSSSVLTVGPNFYSGCTGAYCAFETMRLLNYDDFDSNGIGMKANGLVKGSIINQHLLNILSAGGTTYFINNLDFSTVSRQLEAPATLDNGVMVATGRGTGNLHMTPLGLMGYQRMAAAAGSSWQVTGVLAIGDYVVMTLLAKNVSAAYTVLGVEVFKDDGTTSIAQKDIDITAPIGEWQLFHVALKVTGTTAAHFHIQFDPGAYTSDLADFFVHTVAAPTIITTPFYVFYPQHEKGGVATIAQNAVTSVVTHGLGYTPYNVQALPVTTEIGHLWATSLGDTQFTLNCSMTAHAAGEIYWRAV